MREISLNINALTFRQHWLTEFGVLFFISSNQPAKYDVAKSFAERKLMR